MEKKATGGETHYGYESDGKSLNDVIEAAPVHPSSIAFTPASPPSVTTSPMTSFLNGLPPQNPTPAPPPSVATSPIIDSHLTLTYNPSPQDSAGEMENALHKMESCRRTSHLPPRKPVEIRFVNLSYQVVQGSFFNRLKGRTGYKEILHSLKGRFSSSNLAGILGPSGAGKSSLMDVLSGHKFRGTTGNITVNGNPRNNSLFRKLSCYIMQDDHLYRQFSVMESMMVSAQLNLSKKSTKATKLEIIDEVLTSLDLMGCKNTRVSSLSGGQKKRLAIALELINNPPVMFFDEPTSGLDSSTSFQVMKHLKLLAANGKTVICTIHQPSAKLFEMFDWLYIMAEGHCAYEGKVSNLLPFLTKNGLNCPQYHNPADYVIEVVSKEYGDVIPQLVQSMKDGVCAEEMDVGEDNVPKVPPAINTAYSDFDFRKCKTFNTNELHQFFILLKRTFLGIIRDQLLTHIRFVSHVSIGVLLGLLFLGIGNDAEKVLENNGFLFFTVMFIMFAALMPTVLTFPLELSVLLREHMNYWYSLKAYYVAKTIADFPFQILFPFLYCLIVYYMSSQPPEAFRFFLFLTWVIASALVAQSLGLLIGATSQSVEVATFLGPISTIPVLLFCGFFVRFDTIPYYLKWLGYIAYIRYGFEGVIVSIYGFNRTHLACNNTQGIGCQLSDPVLILEELDVKEENMLFDAGIMAVFFIGLRIAAFLMLKLRVQLH